MSAGPAGQGTETRGHLVQIERLSKIVVRAGIQPRDAVANAVTRGQKKNGRCRPAGSHLVENVDS